MTTTPTQGAPLGEIFHIAHAVTDLEEALAIYSGLTGARGRTSPIDVDCHVRMPMVADEPVRIRGTVAWLVDGPVPVEFWQGGPGSPWTVDHGQVALHHVGYWVSDLDGAAAALAAQGFELEVTPDHNGDGILGFAYLRRGDGWRVEIQCSTDRDAMAAWMRGEPADISWFRELR